MHFANDVLFLLPLVPIEITGAYEYSMTSVNNMRELSISVEGTRGRDQYVFIPKLLELYLEIKTICP
jgi:hypothetical protein